MRIIQKILILIICILIAFSFYCIVDKEHKAKAEVQDSFVEKEDYFPVELQENSTIEKLNIPIPIEEPIIEEPIIEEPIIEIPKKVCSSVDDFYYYTTFTYNGVVQKPKRLTEDEQRYIYNVCQKYKVEYELVLALIGVESTWNLYVGGENGYWGAGQISERLNLEPFLDIGLDIRDPLQTIDCICIILQNKYSKYNDWEMTLIAYNKGNGGAENNYFDYGIFRIPYSEKIIGLRDAMLEKKRGGIYVTDIWND